MWKVHNLNLQYILTDWKESCLCFSHPFNRWIINVCSPECKKAQKCPTCVADKDVEDPVIPPALTKVWQLMLEGILHELERHRYHSCKPPVTKYLQQGCGFGYKRWGRVLQQREGDYTPGFCKSILRRVLWWKCPFCLLGCGRGQTDSHGRRCDSCHRNPSQESAHQGSDPSASAVSWHLQVSVRSIVCFSHPFKTHSVS